MKDYYGYCNKLVKKIQFHDLMCGDYKAKDIFHILGCKNCIYFIEMKPWTCTVEPMPREDSEVVIDITIEVSVEKKGGKNG